jgi:membrane protein DedA with SNARE-associated domain
MPDLVDGLLEALAGLHPSALYVLAGLFTALETSIGIGLLIPGDSVVLLAASTVTTPYRFAALVAVTVLGSVTGESVGYLLGRRCGIGVRTSRLGRRLGEARWVRAEAFLTGRGGRAVAWSVLYAGIGVAAGAYWWEYGDRLGLVGLAVAAVLVVFFVARATRRPWLGQPRGATRASTVPQPKSGRASEPAATPRSSGPEPAVHDPRGPGAARPLSAARQ